MSVVIDTFSKYCALFELDNNINKWFPISLVAHIYSFLQGGSEITDVSPQALNRIFNSRLFISELYGEKEGCMKYTFWTDYGMMTTHVIYLA